MSKYGDILKTCEHWMEEGKPIHDKLAEKMRRLAAKRKDEHERCQRVLRYMSKTE